MNALSRGACGFILISAVLLIPLTGSLWAYRFEICYYRNRDCIDNAAARYQVPTKLVAAVIWQETRFNPLCRGKAGEIGFMQIMPSSASEWAKAEHIQNFDTESLFDPGTNVLAGTWYLGRAIKRWKSQADPLPYALAEYNAGRSNATRWDRINAINPQEFTNVISYPTTRSYVKTVLRNYRSFGQPWKRWGKE
ncbi:MAG: lytic transglycosylase domain-containing protein [bacterium]|jgi:soluble lytic murein transglycosylase